MSILRVPYKSQWDADAGVSKDDCGAASFAMLCGFFGLNITTNGVFDLTDSALDYLTYSEINKAAGALGLSFKGSANQSIDILKQKIDQGIPCMVVLHYGDLPNRQDTFTGAHIVVVVGYKDSEVITNDPDFWGSRRNEGANKAYPMDAFIKSWGSKADGNLPFNLWYIEPPLGWEPDIACTQKLESLTNELIEMRTSRDKWKADYKELSEKYIKEIQDKDKFIKQLQDTQTGLNTQIMSANNQINQLSEQLKKYEGMEQALVDSRRDIEELQNELKKIKDTNPLSMYGRWELIKFALLRK